MIGELPLCIDLPNRSNQKFLPIKAGFENQNQTSLTKKMGIYPVPKLGQIHMIH